MGTAPYGSRVSRADALRALEIAFDHRIRTVDTAPSYGYGESESIVGEFSRGKRDRLFLMTKVGIKAKRLGPLDHLKKPARVLFDVAPGLRRLARPLLGAHQVRSSFSSADVGGSIEQSLRALHADHLDVLCLHGLTLTDVDRHELWEALRTWHERGSFRYLGLSGDSEALRRAGSLWTKELVVQVPVWGNPLERLPNEVFRWGYQAHARPASNEHLPLEARIAGPIAAGACDGIIVTMTSPQHLLQNLEALRKTSAPEIGAKYLECLSRVVAA